MCLPIVMLEEIWFQFVLSKLEVTHILYYSKGENDKICAFFIWKKEEHVIYFEVFTTFYLHQA